MLLRRKKKKALLAAAAREEDGDEADEEDPCFEEQSMKTNPKLNHVETGVDVTHEGKDIWGEPFWHDKWHPSNPRPGTVSGACPFSYVDVMDEIALEDLHMKNSEDLKAKSEFKRSDYNITLFSDRGMAVQNSLLTAGDAHFSTYELQIPCELSPTITLVASTQYQSYTELLPVSSGSKVFNLRG